MACPSHVRLPFKHMYSSTDLIVQVWKIRTVKVLIQAHLYLPVCGSKRTEHPENKNSSFSLNANTVIVTMA
jgi:hypothetical protein